MEPLSLDGNGWAKGSIEPFAPARAWSLLASDPGSRVDLARWAHQARTFFDSALELGRPKKYPDDVTPAADAFDLVLARRKSDVTTHVRIVTVPLDKAPAVRDAAEAAVRAIGGAGFDALIARATRVWQVLDAVDEGGDDRAPLVSAAILASVLLAPIVPPEGAAIFGVKGARERLRARGWG